MTRRIFRCIANPRGDVYFEFLICLVLFVVVFSFAVQIFSAVHLKLWLDDRASAVVRCVQINGAVTPEADALLAEITGKLGSRATAEWDATFIGATRKIQLGDPIRLRVTGEIRLFKSGLSGGVPVEITSEMVGTSEVYWN